MLKDDESHPVTFAFMGHTVTAYPTFILVDGVKISRSQLTFSFQLALAKAMRESEEKGRAEGQ
ncbi:hypothetical protein [Pantoea dispersa]|uniref:hypothetical protein n=1 Tax=Pantoea dispersa TaxID=59814 RepID=UPI00301B445D